LGVYTIAAVLISINWLVFIWAVNHGRVLEASLGYFINPLLSVLLGVVVVGERMTRPQGVAIMVAAAGVAVMGIGGNGLPWVSLVLAGSFAFYGLVKKSAPLPAMLGLLIETSVLLVPAIGYLAWRYSQGVGAMTERDPTTITLLIFGGCLTVLPLALFATAAQRVPLSMMGILQYFGPTLQFIVGVTVFGEVLTASRLLGFAFVWIGSSAFLYGGMKRSATRNVTIES